MKKLIALALVLGLGIQIGRLLESCNKLALAGNDHGGGAEKCVAKNGDVNADGKVDTSDAVTILGYQFLGNPAELAELCMPEHSDLPDTGGKICYGFDQTMGWIEVPCAEAACQGQDGSYDTGCAREDRFTDNGDGTVTDHCMGLMWQKNTADVNGDGQTPDDRSDGLPWCAALAYCENLSFAGHVDWRLPNVRELQSIVDYGRTNPSIDPVFGALPGFCWSSTSYRLDPGEAWPVSFDIGVIRSVAKDGSWYVRAVRNVH